MHCAALVDYDCFIFWGKRGPENKVSAIKFGTFCSVTCDLGPQCLVSHLGNWFWLKNQDDGEEPKG